MRKRKTVFAVLWIAALCLGLLGACGNGGASGDTPAETLPAPPASIGGISTGEHKVIAVVNNESLYEDNYMEWYLQTMSLSLGLDMSQEQDEQVTSFVDGYKISYLGSYTEQTVLLQEAKKANITAEDQAVEDFLSQLRLDYATDEEGFKTQQAMWGFTDESIRRYIKNQLIIQALYEEKTKDITAPAQTPEEYYQTYPMEFNVAETRTVRHILVADRAEAEDIIGSLNEGADFGALVTEKSTDTVSAANGGVIGPFDASGAMEGGGSLVAPFTEASNALEKPGDITQEPVESQFGFHIIILDEISPARTESFDEVKDELTERLLTEAKDASFGGFYNQVMAAAEITYTEGYDPAAVYGGTGDAGSTGGADAGTGAEGTDGAGAADAGDSGGSGDGTAGETGGGEPVPQD